MPRSSDKEFQLGHYPLSEKIGPGFPRMEQKGLAAQASKPQGFEIRASLASEVASPTPPTRIVDNPKLWE